MTFGGSIFLNENLPLLHPPILGLRDEPLQIGLR